MYSKIKYLIIQQFKKLSKATTNSKLINKYPHQKKILPKIITKIYFPKRIPKIIPPKSIHKKYNRLLFRT